ARRRHFRRAGLRKCGRGEEQRHAQCSPPQASHTRMIRLFAHLAGRIGGPYGPHRCSRSSAAEGACPSFALSETKLQRSSEKGKDDTMMTLRSILSFASMTLALAGCA